MLGGPDETGDASTATPGDAHSDATEDFLFHLYRGGELLQDSRVHEAREELERCVRLQPQDRRARDLLAIAYVRLGRYPDAIALYEELLREPETDAALTLNLATCYVKTGQAERAQTLLEALVAEQPANLRAWSHLGLVHKRLGDHERARTAFERAEPSALALSETADTFSDSDAEITLVGMATLPRLTSVPPAAPSPEDTPARQSSRPGGSAERGSAPLLARISGWAPTPDLAKSADALPSLAALVESSRLHYPKLAGVLLHASGLALCTIATSFAARVSAIAQLSPGPGGFSTTPLPRRMRSRALDEVLGGEHDPLVALVGDGGLALLPGEGQRLLTFRMEDDFLFVRETALVAFDTALNYENGRLAAFEGESDALVQLRGRGTVVLCSRGPLVSAAVRADQPTILALRAVLGWAGRLLPRELSPEEAPLHAKGLVAFAGEGTVLASAGVPMNTP